ncbi:MAG: preprotein translocase subunit SecG [Clostridia bacterium]|nr:preprotein translocase subunit SecG [Clostridia bacterium]
MNIAQIILGAVSIVLSVVIIAVIMIQQGKNDGLGAMAGGSSQDARSFYNKNKNHSRDAILSKVTIVCAIILAGVVVAMNLIG